MSKPYEYNTENVNTHKVSAEKGKEYWKNYPTGISYKKPKTQVRISLPPGEGIKLFNMAEISSPGGVTITVKLPFPMADTGLGKLAESIKSCGGTVDIES